MGRIFSDQNRFEQWLAVELAASEALAELGDVPREAAQALRALAGARRALVNVFGDRRGADQADGRNIRMLDERVHDFFVAVDPMRGVLTNRTKFILYYIGWFVMNAIIIIRANCSKIKS